MKKELGRGVKPSAKVSTFDSANKEKDPFNSNLEEEQAGLKEAQKKFKMGEVDGFAAFLQTILELKAEPLYKRDYTDPRWPRDEKGRMIQVERCYFFAMQGPRKEILGFRSLGDAEINGDGKVIVDRIAFADVKTKTRQTDKIILAKKWVAEKTGYRYFWIHEDEAFEDEEAEKVFLERFALLDAKPEFVYGNPTTPGFQVVGNESLRIY